jgi:hypothetical protein
LDQMTQVMRLAQAYVPVQIYLNRWDPAKALMMGTIFPELYRPYYGRERERRS